MRAMALSGYMHSPEWRELVRTEALGRPILAYRERPRHVLDLLELGVGRSEHTFLVQGERRVSHGQFRVAIDAVAARMADAGVTRGARVLFVLYNSPEFLIAQWAAWRLGAVPVLGNRWWGPRDLAGAIERVAPALLVSDVTQDSAAPVAQVSPDDLRGWWDDGENTDLLPDPRSESHEDEVAVIVFTAGSTGAPKGVQLSHRNLVWTQQTIHVLRGSAPRPAASAGDQKVALKTTPLFHNGGMVAAIGTLIDGGRIVMLPGRFDPLSAIRCIERERVQSWSAVPTMFRRVLQHPDLAAHNLSSLVAPATGGSMVSPQLFDDLRKALPNAGSGLTSGYGMTEMSFLTMVTGTELATRLGTVGRPLPGVELRLDTAVADGEGELVARSGALMIGYLDSSERPIDAEGWYHTGDLGHIDTDGFVYVTGRLKDIVIRGGENIACGHVEAALIAHPDVLEAAVFGVADEDFGEALAVAIACRPETVVSPQDLRTFLSDRLAYFEIPTHWDLRREALPVLVNGKVDKQALKRGFAAHGRNAE